MNNFFKVKLKAASVLREVRSGNWRETNQVIDFPIGIKYPIFTMNIYLKQLRRNNKLTINVNYVIKERQGWSIIYLIDGWMFRKLHGSDGTKLIKIITCRSIENWVLTKYLAITNFSGSCFLNYLINYWINLRTH